MVNMATNVLKFTLLPYLLIKEDDGMIDRSVI